MMGKCPRTKHSDGRVPLRVSAAQWRGESESKRLQRKKTKRKTSMLCEHEQFLFSSFYVCILPTVSSLFVGK